MYSSSFCLSRTIPISPLPFKCSERMLYNCLSHLKYFGIIFEIIPTSNLKNNKSDVLQCANACRSELVKMLSLLLPLVVRASPLFDNHYAQEQADKARENYNSTLSLCYKLLRLCCRKS